MTSEPARRSGSVDRLVRTASSRTPRFKVAVVSGPVRTIYVGGQDAVTADGEIVGRGDLGAQTAQILANIETALAAAGAGLEHVIKWNLLVVEGQGRHGVRGVSARLGDRPNPPLITFAFVQGLARPEFLAEMDAIAVVPD